VQHFDEQPTKRKTKPGVTEEKIPYHLQHASEISYFCLNVPVRVHTLHQDYADATQMCLVIISCKLLIIRQEFASFRKGYCTPNPFQTFNLNPLPVTAPWGCCSTSFAFKARPAISFLGVLLVSRCLATHPQRSEAAQQRSEPGTQRPGTVTQPPHRGCRWESRPWLTNVFQTPSE